MQLELLETQKNKDQEITVINNISMLLSDNMSSDTNHVS